MMASRTVRLDDEDEETLERVVKLTGLSISEVFKRGLHSFGRDVLEAPRSRTAFEALCQLDLGPGGYTRLPAEERKSALRESLRKKAGL
jgi:hypothetical protein